ncbi:hypothetical protein OPV22_030252 [Ensete ventricosum]|uniref:Legumain prodomain domain-containing protein n=1 Tax=Ensete ventricosum TaxID=4639 RepID=A0AAV8PZP7_ENSVE|nr:hypothetical protein OPV22_030252 [Ensete ventricosum]
MTRIKPGLVMEYGDKSVKSEKLYLYQGFDPSNANVTKNVVDLRMQMGAISQRDADLLFLWKRVSHNFSFVFVDFYLCSSIHDIGLSILRAVRSSGRALIDDWECLKSMVWVFESRCGSLTQSGI